MHTSLGIFNPDFYADFHRGSERAVDAGLEDEQIADVYGLDEVDVVHRGGDHVGTRVAVGGHGAGEVDEVHQAAAEQVAEGVGIVGQNDLSHLRLRVGYQAGQRGCSQWNSFRACSVLA